MQEIQFFGLYFPPLLVAVFYGLILSLIAGTLINRFGGDVVHCGGFGTLQITVIMSSMIYFLMYI